MNKAMKQVFLPLVLFLVFFSLFGENLGSLELPASGRIVFSDLDLSADNQLLFRAGGVARRGISAQESLFLTRLSPHPERAYPAFPIQQLTAFPERMDLLENGRVLQIRNAFGAVRISLPGGLPMPIPGLPSFAAGNVDPIGRVEEMASSADGRWLLFIDPISPAFGNLMLLDVFSGTKTLVAPRLERAEKQFPASWSPDSRLFIYERDGMLYYYIISPAPMPEDENLRLIGEGTINSISWTPEGDFFYLRRSILYHVRTSELYARVLHADFLAIGVVVGRLPFEFNPAFDDFWIAPDTRSLLVLQGRRSLFYYPLAADPDASANILPHLLLPRFSSGMEVLWPASGPVTVLVSIPHHVGTEVRAWRLQGRTAFEPLPLPSASLLSGSLSPDGERALFWGKDGMLLYDFAAWQRLAVLSSRPAAAGIWVSNDDIIIGDDQKIQRISLARTPFAVTGQELICLSGAQQSGFEEGTFRILARVANAWFATDGRSPWEPVAAPRLRSPSQASVQYRVFLQNQSGGPYANLPMIRNIASVGTFSLFPRFVVTRRPEHNRIALTFGLYDDDHGLSETLDALNRLGIRATFFLNGEFIRRHPEAVMAIAAAGHESASMFFSPIDLSDARYNISADFIARGLARNEDEFYRVTGKELALFWRAPWYVVSPEITAAATRAGYITIGRDLDPLDWVSREDSRRLGLPQRSPSEMVDYIVAAVRPGFIVPIRLGILPDGRNGYLFNRINVLLDALVREGFVLTTVSNLID